MAGLVTILMVCQSVGAAGLLGDVDGDGNVTAKDKMLLSRYVAGWNGYKVDTNTGDIDRDGDVDTEDAALLSQYFAGYAIEGIGEKANDVTGFVLKPEITSGNTLRFTTDVDGTVYYYYLKNDVAPDKEDFIHYWNVGTNCGSRYLTAGKQGDIAINVSTYRYIALCLYDGSDYYEPVVVRVNTDNGFYTEPNVSAEDQISFSTKYDGTVYWYTSENDATITKDDFWKNYKNASDGMCGYLEGCSSKTDAVLYTVEEMYEKYIYFMVVKDDGSEYIPYSCYLIDPDDTGYRIDPYCDLENKMVRFMTEEMGTVYYYYTSEKDEYFENIDEFWDSYSRIRNGGSVKITSENQMSCISFSGKNTSTYPGLMIMCVESDGTEHYPIYVSLTEDVSEKTGITLLTVDETSITVRAVSSGTMYISDCTVDNISDTGCSAFINEGEIITLSFLDSYEIVKLQLADHEEFLISLMQNVDYTKSEEWDNPFTDVYKSATYYKAVRFVYENGLFAGMSATKFEPDTTMTRAMFLTVLGRMARIDTEAYSYDGTFTDVKASDASVSYATPYIQWGMENGIITGWIEDEEIIVQKDTEYSGDIKFAPKDNMTHAEMYLWLERYAANIVGIDTNAAGTLISATDTDEIPDIAFAAIEYASKMNYLVMTNNRITPTADASRAELAMLLQKFCTNVLGWKDTYNQLANGFNNTIWSIDGDNVIFTGSTADSGEVEFYSSSVDGGTQTMIVKKGDLICYFFDKIYAEDDVETTGCVSFGVILHGEDGNEYPACRLIIPRIDVCIIG